VISIITRIVQERNAWFRCHKKKVKARGFGRKLGIYFLAGVFNPSEKYDTMQNNYNNRDLFAIAMDIVSHVHPGSWRFQP
jgi:hypothetical protein